MIEHEIKDEGIENWLTQVVATTRSPRPLFRAFAGTLETETEKNFAAQGRPGWVGLKPATLKRRGAGAKILQDSGQLAGSCHGFYGSDFAGVGTNKPYGPIQHFGGDIERAAFSSWARLRKDAKGSLLRQGDKGKKARLAVFAKAGHKRVKVVRYTVGAHTVHIPARPYLPADQNGRLQEAARPALDADVQTFLRNLLPR
ncbi:phage virion morphogenesis protein [Azonexus sp. R2A-61]|uniref:phage virion morphogenesis protein n=1 Tax=Azonexus sp. R2A61 TaxID=2744443 RepID=UPI001F16349C